MFGRYGPPPPPTHTRRRFDLEKAGAPRAPFFGARVFGKGVTGACDWSRAHTLTDMPGADRNKFTLEPHPLESEGRKRKLEPTPEFKAREIAKKREALLKAADNNTIKEELKKAMAREQIEAIPDHVEQDFIHDFHNWVAGIGKRSDYVKAGVPLASVGQGKLVSDHPSVLNYVDGITSRVIDYYSEIAQMKLCGPAVSPRGGPATLDDLWRYFKYVVRNEPVDPRDFQPQPGPGEPDTDLVGNQDGIVDEPAEAPSLADKKRSKTENELREKHADSQVRKKKAPVEVRKEAEEEGEEKAAAAEKLREERAKLEAEKAKLRAEMEEEERRAKERAERETRELAERYRKEAEEAKKQEEAEELVRKSKELEERLRAAKESISKTLGGAFFTDKGPPLSSLQTPASSTSPLSTAEPLALPLEESSSAPPEMPKIAPPPSADGAQVPPPPAEIAPLGAPPVAATPPHAPHAPVSLPLEESPAAMPEPMKLAPHDGSAALPAPPGPLVDVRGAVPSESLVRQFLDASESWKNTPYAHWIQQWRTHDKVSTVEGFYALANRYYKDRYNGDIVSEFGRYKNIRYEKNPLTGVNEPAEGLDPPSYMMRYKLLVGLAESANPDEWRELLAEKGVVFRDEADARKAEELRQQLVARARADFEAPPAPPAAALDRPVPLPASPEIAPSPRVEPVQTSAPDPAKAREAQMRERAALQMHEARERAAKAAAGREKAWPAGITANPPPQAPPDLTARLPPLPPGVPLPPKPTVLPEMLQPNPSGTVPAPTAEQTAAMYAAMKRKHAQPAEDDATKRARAAAVPPTVAVPPPPTTSLGHWIQAKRAPTMRAPEDEFERGPRVISTVPLRPEPGAPVAPLQRIVPKKREESSSSSTSEERAPSQHAAGPVLTDLKNRSSGAPGPDVSALPRDYSGNDNPRSRSFNQHRGEVDRRARNELLADPIAQDRLRKDQEWLNALHAKHPTMPRMSMSLDSDTSFLSDADKKLIEAVAKSYPTAEEAGLTHELAERVRELAREERRKNRAKGVYYTLYENMKAIIDADPKVRRMWEASKDKQRTANGIRALLKGITTSKKEAAEYPPTADDWEFESQRVRD